MGVYRKRKKYLSLLEASRLTPYSQEYLSLLARKKKIFSKKIGRNWYTTEEAVRRYLQKRAEENLKMAELKNPSDENLPVLKGQLAGTQNHQASAESFSGLPGKPLPSVPNLGYFVNDSVKEGIQKTKATLAFGSGAETFMAKNDYSSRPALYQLDSLFKTEWNSFKKWAGHQVNLLKAVCFERHAYFARTRRENLYFRTFLRIPDRYWIVIVAAFIIMFVLFGGISLQPFLSFL